MYFCTCQPGAEALHTNAVRCHLGLQGPGKRQEKCLATAVDSGFLQLEIGPDGSDIDDRTTALLTHEGQRGANQFQGGVNLQAHHLQLHLQRTVGKVTQGREAGIIDQQIHRPLLPQGLYSARYTLYSGEVGNYRVYAGLLLELGAQGL